MGEDRKFVRPDFNRVVLALFRTPLPRHVTHACTTSNDML
jgi:hypothetical protein